MEFKQKLKNRIRSCCAKCGYKTKSGINATFLSWFFHDQLCNCKQGLSPPKLIADELNTTKGIRIKSESEASINFSPKYKVLEIVGQGGIGTVYKAIDLSNQNVVAIKVLNDELAKDQNILKRFEQEALTVQALNHPNIIAIKEFTRTQDGIPYIVMNYAEGQSLAQLIKRRGCLSISDVASITTQIIQAMNHAHENGIIHRDLKPNNIIVDEKDNGFNVKVVDFGIAKAIANNLSDESLTGRNPFHSKNPVEAMVKQVEAEAEPFEIEFSFLRIPARLEKIILKCLQKNPNKRYQSILDMDKDLKKAFPPLLRHPITAALWR
jgi:eukaryotic-like serine/threonine-protein kinase